MAAKKRGTESQGISAAEVKAMGRAFQQAVDTDDKNALEQAGGQLVRLLRASQSAEEVERVLRAHGGALDDDGSVYPLPDAIDALFDRAAAMPEPKEAAKIISWISRSCSPPLVVVGPPPYAKLAPYREKARVAIEAHIGEIRAWLKNAAAERRTGAAYLISLSTSDHRDAAALLALAKSEKEPAVMATCMLGAAVVGRRLRQTRDELMDLARLQLGDKSALVRLCAATAMAVADLSLPAEAVAILAEHATKPIPLPAEWGIQVASPPPIRSDWWALELLTWIRTDAPEDAVNALESIPAAGKPQDASLVLEAYMHMAVEAKHGPVDAMRLVGPALDDLARRALTVVASGRFSTGWRGLSPAAIGGMLAARDPEWRPIDVEVDGRTQRLHFNALLAGVALNGWPIMSIRDALMEAFDASTLADLVAKPTATDTTLSRMIVAPIQGEREQRFAVDVLLALERKGLDLEAFLRAAVEGDDCIPARLAPIVLLKHPRSVPVNLRQLVSDGITSAVSSEPLLGLLRPLSHEERVAILRAARPDAPGALPIWGLELHEPLILRKLVYLAVEASRSNRRQEVLALLSGGDAEMVKVLRTVTVAPGSSYEQSGTEFIASVVKAIETRVA